MSIPTPLFYRPRPLSVCQSSPGFCLIFYCHDFLVQDKCTLHKILLTFIFWVFDSILKTSQLFVMTGVLFLHVFISSLFQSLSLQEILVLHDWSSFALSHNQLLYSWRFSRYSTPIHWLVHCQDNLVSSTGLIM